MLYCKQTNDYLPAPEAVMVTGITPQECNERGGFLSLNLPQNSG